MGSNIILVGMPACGKTTIGAMLADKLPEYIHIDIDSLIEKTQGLSICEIFQKYSEDYFRKLEYDTIKLACACENRIISTGGGSFENPDNRVTLLKSGKVFYLKTDIDVLYNRVSKDNVRPLLAKDVMSEKPKRISKKDYGASALNLMEKYSITALAVVDENNKPIGVIHIHDLLKAGVA